MKVAEYTTRAPVILPEILDTVSSHNPSFYNPTIERGALATHISGSFCVSITAATGIPKLETGPQKSNQSMAISNQHLNWSSSLPFIAASQPARPRLVWIVYFLLFCWSFPACISVVVFLVFFCLVYSRQDRAHIRVEHT